MALSNGSMSGITRDAAEILKRHDHPLRRALVDELHVRRFPSFSPPFEMTQLVMYTADMDERAVRKHVERLDNGSSPAIKGRYFTGQFSDITYIWESHTEFSTYSFVRCGQFEKPFVSPVLLDLPLSWIEDLPGRTIRATQVAVLDRLALLPDEICLKEYFDMEGLVCADVSNLEARLWSNFRVHDDGFGRLLLKDIALKSPGDASRLLQRVQELGNYRNMALLGLPLVQARDSELRTLELQLAGLTREVAHRNEKDNDDELFRLVSELSARLANLMSDTRYRVDATTAYAQIVSERLDSLHPTRVPGYQTLVDFTERRLLPDVRTCESFMRRLDTLSQRTNWVGSLIRTRIETTLSHQNTDLLRSMNERTRMQLKLQQTVEGLSVLAISYYAISIIGYLARPLSIFLDEPKLLGFIAPVVVIGVWFFIRRIGKDI